MTRVYTDKDFLKNEIRNAVAHPVTSFPANAREGQMIYHSTFKAFFVCINQSMDTTLKGAWGLGRIELGEIWHDEDINKVLITTTGNSITVSDVDGGTF